MHKNSLSIKPISFQEHPVIDFAQFEPHVYDITAVGFDFPSSFILKGFFLMDSYCQSLICKIKKMVQSNLPDFIEYQCSLMKNPSLWLDQLENLIEVNLDLFEEQTEKLRINKLYVIIQLHRKELKPKHRPLKNQLIDWSDISLGDNHNKFDFIQVKFDLDKLDSYDEKIAYLIELKADYLESVHCFIPYPQKSFDALIDIELNKIEKLSSLKSTVCVPNKNRQSKRNVKFRIYSNINVLVDIFFQLINEFRPEGRPFLNCSATEVAELIVNNFLDRDGQEISINTVRTILSPGKSDKRPSIDKRFKIQSVFLPLIGSTYLYLLSEMVSFYSILPEI